ncbi:SRPBCC family protein [Streptomyces sp. NPDC048643]|uniref:SRPBCC family protein n=1 Tax=Streptomyces sp. NPDC048643 TaxID=3155637 RepID=UPI003436FB3E
MAIRHQVIERSPEAVWAVLEDPRLYAEWVVGTSESRPVDGRWPEVGARLAYVVGRGRLAYEGRTVVRRVERLRWLELEADSGRLGTARIAIEVRTWGPHSLVLVDEHPLRGLGGALHTAPLEVVIQLRHRKMLARLAKVVERRSAPAASPDVPAPEGLARRA